MLTNALDGQEIGLLVQKRVVASAQTLLRLIGPDAFHCASLRGGGGGRHPTLQARGSGGGGHSKQLQQGAYAVFEDMLQRSKSAPPPLAGPDLARLMRVGTRVVRGADWKWDDQGRWVNSEYFSI